MPRGPRQKSVSGIYHIMLRGANKQEIFHDDEDCMKFLDLLKKYKFQTNLTVYGWCLMSNHVHLLIKEGNEDVSTTMKRIGVSFVWYYNLKYKTTGHLFQDRFRSEGVESIRYLLTVIRYIHQNPVKAGIAKQSDEWKWSSFRGYFRENIYPNGLVDCHFILEFFSSDGIVAKKRFIEFSERENKDEYLEKQFNERKRLSDEEARQEIKELLGVVKIAQVKSLPKLERNQVLRKVKRIDGVTQRQAARIFGVSPSLVSKA
ncbi:transposase [Aquibacillus halophilus]|uniref:Transposase n=1 Tax=Aquibacillus halophilus TaxID=930132 RepID=A0A6A8D6A0_9BACI|nr:transposase [Aquibacillus halophilus]MRH41108.1 transposase [Aquibacillus halophilus]